MIDDNFNLGKYLLPVLEDLPSFRFREKSNLVHNASDVAKCSRQVTYKALGYEPSNATDLLGNIRMKFGDWVEKGLIYTMFSKLGLLGTHLIATQGDAGEQDFYGTRWHGFRDLDLVVKTPEGYNTIIVEFKAKVGSGASMTIKESAWGAKYKKPFPDTDWGYAQQLSLYLRNAYNKTNNNPKFKRPITDGILAYFLYDNGLATILEFHCTYRPETDSVLFYKTYCEHIPEVCHEYEMVISLKDIADRWKLQDEFITKGELAPPDYQRKYNVNDDRVKVAYKTHLQDAIKDKKLIGDIQCAYCPYKDKCASDLNISLEYSKEEKSKLKEILANK